MWVRMLTSVFRPRLLGSVTSVGSIVMILPKIIRIDVRMEDSNVVRDLKNRVQELEEENSQLKQRLHRSEYNLRCQHIINLQLSDYCQDHKYPIPKRLFKAVFKD